MSQPGSPPIEASALRQRQKRALLVVPCAFFIFAAIVMTAPMPNVGAMGVFGMDPYPGAFCILAFIPFVLLFLFAHWFARRDSDFRCLLYFVTSFAIVAIVVWNLLSSPPYGDQDAPTISSWLKSVIAPGGVPPEAGVGGYLPPENDVVLWGLGVGLVYLALAGWDAWCIHRRPVQT